MVRSIWSGVLSFGLVNINVSLHPATRSKALSFNLLNKEDKHPIGYQKIDKAEGTILSQKDIVKGFEFEKGAYVVLEDEDFEKAEIKTGRSINVENFIDLESIDPIYYQKSYYLAPTDVSKKAYDLLLRALKDQKKAAIARFVLRNKQHLALVRPKNSALLLETMYYEDEIVPAQQVVEDNEINATQEELELAKTFIDRLSKPFNPAAYKDQYRQNLQNIIDAKIKGKEVVAPAPEEKKPVVDIMAALKESIEKAKKAA